MLSKRRTGRLQRLNPIDDGREQDAAKSPSHEQTEFVVEEAGVFTALLEFHDSFDHP
jgi:hypothetical protein